MTVLEMHTAFNQGLQRVNSSAYDYFTDEEINHWLNRAQERFIKDRAFITGDVKRVGFEGNQKRLDDIRTLVSQDYFDGWTANTDARWEQVNLPADYEYLVNLRAATRYDVCGDVSITSPQRDIPVRIVDNAEVYAMQRDPFAKSTFESPLGTISENDIRVYQDGESFILEGIYLDYVRIPAKIDLSLGQDCELAPHTHQEIVDIAVKNILEAIESPRYQTNSGEQLTSE